jgi:hypothetical protein
MLFELVILAGCHGQACRIERPLLERRVTKSVVVRVEKQVTKERKVRRFRRVR